MPPFLSSFLIWKSHSPPPGRTGAICSWDSMQNGGCQSVRTVLKVARRHLLPHSSVPTRFLHSSGPFPLWGPHHRCHRSCHCSLAQWGTRKPNSHCTAAPAAGSAPLRSESSLQGEQELWESHKKDPKATGDEPVASKNSSLATWQDCSPNDAQEYYPPPKGQAPWPLRPRVATPKGNFNTVIKTASC